MSGGALEAEEQARANIYGLIARLFYQAPDAQLLGELLNAQPFGDEKSEIAAAWREMTDACRKAFPVQLEDEHTELFIGTGKAEVTPYLSHYVLAHANDTPLVEVRQQLNRWGLARRDSAHEPEDHIAALCEAMRMAIAVQQRSLDEQRAFFRRFVYRGAVAFCAAVSASSKARFYRSVARLTRAFIELENEAFDIA
jgi:TorA maturation chaperone TorD